MYVCMCVYVCVFGLSTRVLIHGVCHGRVEAGKRMVEGSGEVVEDKRKEERGREQRV